MTSFGLRLSLGERVLHEEVADDDKDLCTEFELVEDGVFALTAISRKTFALLSLSLPACAPEIES